MSVGEVKNRECKLLTGPLRAPCSFCRTKTTDELKLGPIYESHGLVVHYFCLLTASSLPQNGEDEEGIFGFHLPDIQKELKVTATRICVYCKRKGASVSCCSQKCRRWFHLTCGRKNHSLHQFFGRFKSFCSSHRPKQRVDKDQLGLGESKNDLVCPICYEHVVIDSLDSLWAPCCKKNAWFHRDCVQKLALSAGYFFKCPLCNNEAIFREAMEKFGIYIPQRDALWEQVPNAYQELLYQYRRCDAKDCKCPRGRTHNGQSNWELVRCKTCGSQGVHITCGRLKFSDPEWLCRLCTDVLKSRGTVVRTAATERSRSSSSSSGRSDQVESTVPINQPDDFQLSSNSDSNDSSRGQPRRSNSRSIRVTRSNPSPTPPSANKPEIISNSGIYSPPIKRSKPCPKRFKKHFELETEDKSNTQKTETSAVLKIDTAVSVSKETPAKVSTNNAMVLDSDSDEEIEVLEVHRVLERKSLTANDGTKLEVHPVSEKKKVVYEIRDFPEPSSSTAAPGPEGLTPPKIPEESSASSSPSISPPWRSVDPKLFYKPTSSVEKCDRLTKETSGSPQSLTKENIEVLVKDSGCQINQIRTPPKKNSAAAEGNLNSLKPSLTVIPLTTSSCSNPERIPVKSFLETVPPSPSPSRPSPSQLLMRNSLTSVALPNQNICLSLNKPNPPARRDSIEEITIIDEPLPPKPVTTPSTNNLPNFQPKIVNVRSYGNLPNSGPTMIRPIVPFVPQTGPVLNTNVILCTTGLWLPTSESFLTAPIFNPTPPTMAQPVRKPTTPLQPQETDLNIKISDVRHSNESKSSNEFSNGRRNGWSDNAVSTSASTRTLEQSNFSRIDKTPNHLGDEFKSPPTAYKTRSSLSIKDGNTTGCSRQKPIVSSKHIDVELPAKSTVSADSDARKELGAGCDSSGIEGDSKSDPAPISSEAFKVIALDNRQGLLTKPERKNPSIARINRPCPKRFKPLNITPDLPEPRSSDAGTPASQSDLAGEKYGQKVAPKRSCRLCPKCLKPRRGAR